MTVSSRMNGYDTLVLWWSFYCEVLVQEVEVLELPEPERGRTTSCRGSGKSADTALWSEYAGLQENSSQLLV